jgi:hypothetical protein
MAQENTAFRSRSEFQELQELVAFPDMSLIDRHRAGQLVEKLLPSGERRYGENAMVKLTIELELPRKSNVLTQLRTFSLAYTLAEVKQLQKPARGSEFRFNWGHLQRLMFVRRSDRARLERECRLKEWSTAELNRRLKAARNRGTKGGAPLKRPVDAIDAMVQVQLQAEGFLKRARRLWLGGEAPTITPEVIARAGVEGQRVAAELATALKELGTTVEQLQAVLEAGAPAPQARKRPRKK